MTTDDLKISSIPPLTTNDVSQVLRDIILEHRTMKRACAQSWDEIFAGLFHIEVEGWHLVLFNDCGELDYCDECISPDGRRWSFESVGSEGIDPIFLLGTEERAALERLLQQLKTVPLLESLCTEQSHWQWYTTQGKGSLGMNNSYATQAKDLLSSIGVHPLSEGVWAFTDVHTASQAYIHHSQQPVALAAYTAVNATFAAGRFPKWALVDMVDKVPCMDGAELTALAMVCGASIPTLPSASARANIFGQAVWDIVEAYSLEACFEHVARAYGSPGRHYNLRPRGFDWGGGEEPIPEELKAMRKSYRAMSPLQQIMVLTIMHLYCQGKDKTYLTGGCPTKIPAAEAMNILRSDGPALSAWGHMVTHYAGW